MKIGNFVFYANPDAILYQVATITLLHVLCCCHAQFYILSCDACWIAVEFCQYLYFFCFECFALTMMRSHFGWRIKSALCEMVFQVTYNTLLRALTRYGSLHDVQQCLAMYQDMRKAGYEESFLASYRCVYMSILNLFSVVLISLLENCANWCMYLNVMKKMVMM